MKKEMEKVEERNKKKKKTYLDEEGDGKCLTEMKSVRHFPQIVGHFTRA